VDEIVFKRVKDGQLDACGLTMSELTTVRTVFSKTLRSMLHARIEYPKDQVEDPPSGLGTKGGKVVVSVDALEKARSQKAKSDR
jgi:hypothetical protein